MKNNNFKYLMGFFLMAIFFMAVPLSSTSAALEYEDLNNWTAEGDSNAVWEIEPGGRTVVQYYNGYTMFFLSPNTGIDRVIQGTLLQDDDFYDGYSGGGVFTGDGDDMGYVFGYQDSSNYYLFEWAGPDYPSQDLLLYRVQNGSMTLIQEYNSLEWQKGVTYEVRILYMSDAIRVSIDGTIYLDVTPADVTGVSSFPEGKYGFYNRSQGAVQYGNVQTAPGSLTEVPPVTEDDNYGMDENTTLNVDRFSGLLANDYDPNLDDFDLVVNGTTLSSDGASTTFDPGHGSVTVYGDGHLSYTPDTDFTGEDTFTYYLTDNDGNSNTATVTFNVMELNVAPTDISLSSNTIHHHAANDTVIGTFSTTDGNTSDVHDYLLLDNGGGRFGVSDDQLIVADGSLLDEGDYSIEVRSTDLRGASVDKVFTIQVVDQPPYVDQPIADVSVDEDAADVSIDLSSVFSDPDDDDSAITKTLQGNSNSSLVSASIAGDDLTLNFQDDQFGTATITVRGTSHGKTVDDSFAVTVAGVNDDPVIAQGSTTSEVMDEDGSPDDFDLTLSADDVEGETLTWSISSPASNGNAGASGTGSSKAITYLPDPNWNGSDSFVVRVTDASGGYDEITVDVTVNPVDDPPQLDTSSGNSTWVEDGSAVVVDPGLTITDPDGGSIQGANVNIDNAFPGDELSYPVFLHGVTGSYNASTAILTLTGSASPSQYQEILRSITFSSSEDEPDLTQREITFTLSDAISFEGNGHYYEYIPDSGITWDDAKTAASLRTLYGLSGYLATVTSAEENGFIAGKLTGDGWMGASDSAVEGTWRWVTGPEGLMDSGSGLHFFTQTSSQTGDSYGGAQPGGGVPEVDGSGDPYYENWSSEEPNDWDNDEDVAHFYSDDGEWNDFANDNSSIDGYVVEYGGMPGDTPAQISDTRGLTITAVNDPPTCNPVSISATEDNSASTAADCLDDDGDPLTYLVSQPTVGSAANSGSTLIFDPDGEYEYLAAGEVEEGDGDFVYSADDGSVTSSAVEVDVTVSGVNDDPTAGDDAVSTDEDTAITTVDLVGANDSDPDSSDSLGVAGINTTGTLGTVTDHGDGTFTYDPNGQFEGLGAGDSAADSFDYSITDGNGGSDSATVTVTVDGVNDGPTAVDDTVSTDEDTPFTTGDLTQNDTDPEPSDTLAVTDLDDSGTIGLVTTNGDGTFNYDPAGQYDSLAVGESVLDTFRYTISDSSGATDTAVVSVTVNGANDSPVAVDDAVSTNEDTPFTTGDLTSNDSDPDSTDILSVASMDTTGTLGVVTNNGDGTFHYDPDGQFDDLAVGDQAADSFTYTVSDGNGGSFLATVTVTINGANDTPSAEDDHAATPEDTPVMIDVLDNDSDVDNGDNLTVLAVTQGIHGTVKNNGVDVTYLPDANYAGNDSFTYTAEDKQGDTHTANVTVDVNETDDMQVSGGGNLIPDGDGSPRTADNTDFGSTALFLGTVEHTFAIHNQGNIDLNLIGDPKVEITGAHAGDFTVTTQPSSPLTDGETTTFSIEFDPNAAGLREAGVSIESDDLADPYTFAIQGTATVHDSDGDGVTDNDEGDGDRDNDGVVNYQDYDPTGYFYDEDTGEIISGGSIEVTGPGTVTLVEDGSEGYYQFITDGTPGTYTLDVTVPSGYALSGVCLQGDPPAFDPSGEPDPVNLGNGENADTGFLTSNACTTFYLTFDLEGGDPAIINNNIPLENLPLPDTGFAPGQVTSLPPQPARQTYRNLGSMWLEVPSIDVQTSLVGIPAVEGQWDVTWLGERAGYLSGTAFPTWRGNTVITGHVWNADNSPGVFLDLKDLTYGDTVRIHAWGQVFTYRVQSNRKISPYAPKAVFEHKDQDWITLFTCEGYGKYAEEYGYRRMVRAVLVNVE